MKVLFAADHAGFELKNILVTYVRDELGYDVEDFGADARDPDDDYPDYVVPAARKVAEDPENVRAIVLGGSGEGEAIASNRFKGVHAVVYYGGDNNIIVLSREHNNANVLSLGARFLSPEEAKDAVKTWLETKFPGEERYARRIQAIDDLELISQ